MNALETFANQIETYGYPYHKYTAQDTKCIVKLFLMDSDTIGVIVYNSDMMVKEAKFIRNYKRNGVANQQG